MLFARFSPETTKKNTYHSIAGDPISRFVFFRVFKGRRALPGFTNNASNGIVKYNRQEH